MLDLSTDESSDLELHNVSSELMEVRSERPLSSSSQYVTTPAPPQSGSGGRGGGEEVVGEEDQEEAEVEEETEEASGVQHSTMDLGDSSGEASKLVEDAHEGGVNRYSDASGLNYSLGAQAHHLQQRLSHQTKEVLLK
jgi:hypothetical protein